MSSPWDPAISQAMQRHGGSNRSIPKTVPAKPALSEAANDRVAANPPRRESLLHQGSHGSDAPATPERKTG